MSGVLSFHSERQIFHYSPNKWTNTTVKKIENRYKLGLLRLDILPTHTLSLDLLIKSLIQPRYKVPTVKCNLKSNLVKIGITSFLMEILTK